MKKVLSFVCVIAMMATLMAGMAITASATEPAVLKAEFAGFDVKNATTVFAKINLSVDFPGEFSPYEEVCDDTTDWETVLRGRILGTYAVNLVATPDGLTFNSGLTTAPDHGSKPTYNTSIKELVYGKLVDAPANGYGAGSNGVVNLGTVAYKLNSADFNTDKSYDISFNEIQTSFYVWDYATGEKVEINYKKDKGNLTLEGCTVPAYPEAQEPAEFDVTYAANDKVVFAANADKTVEGKVNVEAYPAFGYKIAAVTGVANVIAEGGVMEATLTENTEIVVTVEEINAAGIYAKVIPVEGVNYVFAKAPAGAAEYGVLLTKDDAPVAAYVNGAYKADGKFVATAVNGAFGIGFTFNSDIFAGVEATAYADALTSAAMAIN